jgi:hemolysin activation/secretion protein
VSGGVSVNNLGSPFTGKNQALGSLNFYNSLLDGDHLSLSYTTTEDGNSLRNYSGSYDFPANSSGMRLGMTSALTHYALTGNFSQTGGVGQAKIIGLNSKIPIEINSDFRDDFSWGVNHVELLDTTLTTFSPRKLNEIWTDLRGVAVYSLGNSSFGFGITSGNLDTENSNILATSGSYQLFNFDTKQQLTQKNLDELLSLRLQLANKNLDSYHKFALGGATAVRAFPIGEASGDIGLVATSEIGYTTSNMAGVFRLAGFYDVGKVDYNFAPLTSITNTLVLSGYGIQIDWTSSKRSKLSFFIAKPYGGDRQISVVDGSSTRTGASLNCSF